MIYTTAVFERKEPYLKSSKCVVEKVIELSKEVYEQFNKEKLDYYTFIEENKELMYEDEQGMHCILILGEGMEDGILIESEGASYARYAAVLPNARTLWNMDQHPELKTHNANAIRMVEKYKEKILNHHQDGIYRILLEDFEADMDAKYVSGELLAELLEKDERFQQVELIDDEIFIVLSQEVCMAENAKGMSVSM